MADGELAGAVPFSYLQAQELAVVRGGGRGGRAHPHHILIWAEERWDLAGGGVQWRQCFVLGRERF
jgi:hypothetical protein